MLPACSEGDTPPAAFGNDEHRCAQPARDVHRIRDLPHRQSLIEVHSSVKYYNRYPAHLADDEAPAVPWYARHRKARKIAVLKRNGAFDAVDESPKARTEDQCRLRLEFCVLDEVVRREFEMMAKRRHVVRSDAGGCVNQLPAARAARRPMYSAAIAKSAASSRIRNTVPTAKNAAPPTARSTASVAACCQIVPASCQRIEFVNHAAPAMTNAAPATRSIEEPTRLSSMPPTLLCRIAINTAASLSDEREFATASR